MNLLLWAWGWVVGTSGMRAMPLKPAWLLETKEQKRPGNVVYYNKFVGLFTIELFIHCF